jgi:hypothetical protein
MRTLAVWIISFQAGILVDPGYLHLVFRALILDCLPDSWYSAKCCLGPSVSSDPGAMCTELSR